MKLLDCPENVKPLRLFWFLGLSCIWLAWTFIKAHAEYERAQARLATLSGVSLWWHKGDPEDLRNETIIIGFFLLTLVFVVSHYIAIVHAAYLQNETKKHLDMQNERERRDFENKMQDMERDNDKHAHLSKAALSKQEVIMRLGSIDQFVRVVEIETDVSKRTVALQAAQGEITTLAAKVASDQINREAIDAPEIREHALETSSDLARLGLSEDRLNRDIIRMFKLGAT